MACGKPFVIVRNRKKDYGTAKMVEGRLNPGQRVMIVEDVVTTGGQVLEAAKTLSHAGATIEFILAVIDHQEGGMENIPPPATPAQALFTSADLGVTPTKV